MPPHSRSGLLPCDTCEPQAAMQQAPPARPSTFTCLGGRAAATCANKRPPPRPTNKPKQPKPVILYTKLLLILTASAPGAFAGPLSSAAGYSTTVLGAGAPSAAPGEQASGANQQPAQANLVAPTIDYSHNMRILKLPRSTPVGSLIYRLKGSDADPNTQLVFGVSGIEGRALLEVEPTPKSWNEADVYLRASLANAEQTIYNLTVWVSDGNKTTQVDSTVLVTEDSGAESPLSPWVSPRHVFQVPENAQPDETIGALTVLESQTSELPVRFELRGKGADKFALKYVFGPTRGQSRAELVLAQPLDYERQNLFSLRALALNARTDTRLDTRNVATLDLVLTVADVQDTPPRFRSLPAVLRLANTLEAGATVAKVEAEDGDSADQRPVGYALDANSPLASYFDIDKASGEIKLAKSAAELALHSSGANEWTALSVFASELPDAAALDRLWPPMVARAEIPLQLVDVLNEPPVFLGGWQSRATPSALGSSAEPTRLLHGYLGEPGAGSGAGLVRWHTNSTPSGWPMLDKLLETTQGRPIVLDLGSGPNGTFELSLEGPDARLFELEPALPVTKQSGFTLSVRPQVLESAEERALFDREAAPAAQRHQFNLDIVARDFGTGQRLSSRISCLIELLDADDNAPHFDASLYTFSVYENAPPGQVLGQVRARDPDSGEAGRVRYTSLSGFDNQLFRLHPDSGQVTLEGHLDREKRNLYLLLGEARDLAGSGKPNYTQIQVQVLDVNDNAPQFTQPHYDAVLAPDGNFHAPLVVRAVDADEPQTANSQVAYEIIAGNQNDLFAIDAHSGAIYPTGGAAGEHKIPSVLSEPIAPYSEAPAAAGKILPEQPAHEVEEATYPSVGRPRGLPLANQSAAESARARYAWPRSSGASWLHDTNSTEPDHAPHTLNYTHSSGRVSSGSGTRLPTLDAEQLPALDLLLQLESEQAAPSEAAKQQPHRRSLLPATSFTSSQSIRAPPLTTLIVRAHDFGIPLRSSTVKVNIHNQAMQSRSLSVILNGTAEALEQRREAIERAFSSMTGSRAQIESIEALSESSGISVARVKLAVPQHSLVDLTDLSALISAIDYRHPSGGAAHWPGSEAGRGGGGQVHTIAHYNPGADQLGGPQHQPPSPTASNITSGRHIFGDIYSHPLEPTLSSDGPLERRLLIYIIIVAVCILALLVVWMVYTCSREDQIKIIEKAPELPPKGNYRPASEQNSANVRSQATNTNKTFAKTVAPSGGGAENEGSSKKAGNQQGGGLRANSSFNELLLPPGQLKPDHYSMYNGQVWFEPAGEFHQVAGRPVARPAMLLAGAGGHKRRASSAPSTGGLSLDSALHSAIQGGHPDAYDGRRLAGSVTPRNASGQFFPNTLGYMENLAALAQADEERYALYKQPGGGGARTLLGRRQRGRKVAPLSDEQPPNKPPRTAHLNASGHTNHAYSDDDDDTEERRAARQERRHSQTTGGRRAQQSDGSKRRPSGARRHSDEDEERSGASTRTGSSLEVSVVLDSDQELLGFDSTGTPIIATHTRPNANKSLLLDMLEPQAANALLADANAAASQRLLAAGSQQQASLQRQAKAAASNQTGATLARQQPVTRVTPAARRPQSAAPSESAPPPSTQSVQLEERAPPGGASEQPPTTTTTSKKASWASNEEGAKREESSEQSKQESREAPEGAAEAGSRRLESAASRASSGSSQRRLKGDELRKANSQADLMSELSARLNTRRQLSVDEAGAEAARSTAAELAAPADQLREMKNGELLEKQSIFALTYSGLNTQKLPA